LAEPRNYTLDPIVARRMPTPAHYQVTGFGTDLRCRLTPDGMLIGMVRPNDHRVAIRGVLRSEWAQITPAVKRIIIASMSAGGIFASVGVAIDILGGWSSLPFSTNLVSSLTAAFFGVPLGLTVLQRLYSLQARATERAALQGEARFFANRLSDDIMKIYGGALDASIREAQNLVDRIGSSVGRMNASVEHIHYDADAFWAQPPEDLMQHSYWEESQRFVDAVEEMRRYYRTHLSVEGDVQRAWDDAQSTARYLFEELRPRYLNVIGSWVNEEWIRYIGTQLEAKIPSMPSEYFRLTSSHHFRELLDCSKRAQNEPIGLVVAPNRLTEIADAAQKIPEHIGYGRRIVEHVANVRDALELDRPDHWRA
jgi:hypothetical protein